MVDFDWRTKTTTKQKSNLPPFFESIEAQRRDPTGFEYPSQEPQQKKDKIGFDWRSRTTGAASREPSIVEKGEAAGKGIVSGGLEFGPIATGAYYGFRAGAPAGPYGAIGGLVLGGLGGYFAGQKAVEAAADIGIAVEDMEDIPPELRSSFAFGETLGGSAVIMTAPAAAAYRGVKLAENVAGGRLSGYINRLLGGIRGSPKAFATAELGTSATAGVGAYYSEELFPGNPLARAGLETVGGLVNPAAIISRGTPAIWTLVKRITKTGRKAGREDEAAKVYQEAVIKEGENPDDLATYLEQLDISGPQLTVGMRAPSPALKKIEAELVAASNAYSTKFGEVAEKGLLFLRKSIDDLRNVGSVEALREAARVRQEYYNKILTSKLSIVEAEAVDAAQEIVGDAIPAGMRQQDALISLNRQTYEKMDEVLTEARQVESQLWSKVPKDIPVQSNSLFETWGTLAEQFTDRYTRRRLNYIKQEMKDLAEEGGVTTSGKLMKIRSSFLEEARIARANKQYATSRVYNQMAESILKDLEAADDLVLSPSLTDARLFSKELNNVFTRSFVGDALSKDKVGAERMLPEEILDKAFGSGGIIGLANMNDIEAATRFLSARGIGGADQMARIKEINGYQESILRIAAAEAVDFRTKRVNIKKLDKFLLKNDVILDRFPAIKVRIKAAIGSEQARADFARYATGRTRFLEKQHSLAKLAKYDSPANALRLARRQPRVIEETARLMRQAKRLGSDAELGMRAAIMEDSIRVAEKARNESDYFRILRDSLFGDLAKGTNTSIMNVAVRTGIMSRGHVQDIEEIITKVENVVTSIKAGEASLIDTGQLTILEDVMLRILGAKGGRFLEQSIPGAQGHGLIAEAAGSRAIRTLFTGVTDVRIRGLIEEATMNRDLAVKLLRKPTSAKERAALGRQVYAFMTFAGINLVEDVSDGRENQDSR